MRTLADTRDSREGEFTAAGVEASTVVSAAGAAVGATRPSDSDGAAGAADGGSVSAGGSVGLPTGPSILILTGTASGGAIRTSIPLQPTSIHIRTSGAFQQEGGSVKRVARR